MVDLPGAGRFDAVLASIVSSWPSRPGSPGLSTYASCPGGPSKISVSMCDNANWKTESVVVIDAPAQVNRRVVVASHYREACRPVGRVADLGKTAFQLT